MNNIKINTTACKTPFNLNSDQEDPEWSFKANFNDGSTFRCLIEYLRGTSTTACFIFNKDNICCKQSEEHNLYMNDVTIDVADLESYHFDSKNSCMSIVLQLEDLCTNIKSVGKKDGIFIYKNPNDNNILLNINSSKGTGSTNLSILKQVSLEENQKYIILEYNRNERNPNSRVVANTFSNDCANIKASKCNTVTFFGYNNGFIIKSDNESKILKYGNIIENELIEKFVVPIALIKLWTKLKNISDIGTVRVFFEKSKPLKIFLKTGYFGILRIYVNDAYAKDEND